MDKCLPMSLKSSDALLLALQEAGATDYSRAVDEETIFRIAKTYTGAFHSRHFNGGKFLMERRLLWERVSAKEVACIRRKQENGQDKSGYLFYLKRPISSTIQKGPFQPNLPTPDSRYAQSEKFWTGTKVIPFVLFRLGAQSPESAVERAGLSFRARYVFSFYDPAFHEGELLNACLDYCIAAHRVFYVQKCGTVSYFLSEDGARFAESIDPRPFEQKLAQFEECCVVIPLQAKGTNTSCEVRAHFLNETCTVKDIFPSEALPTRKGRVCLVVDSRENKRVISVLQARFSSQGFPVRVAPLPCGDYTWAELGPDGVEEKGRLRCVIERKTIEDFGATVAQNNGERHKRQVEKLKAQEGRVCYLIEGNEKDGAAHFYGVPKSVMEAHMVALVENYGFLVIRTKDTEATVRVLLNLTRELDSLASSLK